MQHRITNIFGRARSLGVLLVRLGRANPEAVKRWAGIKTKPTADAIARRVRRPRLLWQQRDMNRVIEGALVEIARQTKVMAERGFSDSYTIFNVALHFLLAERDIQALKIDMLTHPDPWTRGLALRVILLTIYEWDAGKVTGTNEVTGRRFREALDSLQVPEASRSAMTEALRRVRRTRERVVKSFGDVRNKAIAHRDADALLQYDMIRDLSKDDVLPLVADFYGAVRLFIRALPDAMAAAGCTGAIFKQIVEKGAKLPGLE